jgi:hypothetical protein
MNEQSRLILKEEMKILFRGEDSPVTNRNISDKDIKKIRLMDIELINTYMDKQDDNEIRRAKRTIDNIKQQINNLQGSV